MQTNTNDKKTLDNLTDYQKSLLTRLSYLDINMKQFKELKQNGKEITISDLSSLLSSPDASYLGDMKINGSTEFVTGVDTSNKDLLQQIVDSGLGNLKIINIVDDSKSGFQAMCFSDSVNNTGFSFRGTDVKSFSSLAKDSIADIEGFLINDSKQLSKANELFEQQSNNDGKNYLYGHSLGGFLAENIYANNYENIENIYVINPLHINQDQLNTQDKINAFNNTEKFNCYITGGDYVSTINNSNLFKDNIKYIKNSNNTKNNIIGNHLIESSTFDKNGNFITQNKEEAYKGYEKPLASTAISIINNNKIKSFFSTGLNFAKKTINSIKKGIISVKNFVGNTAITIKNNSKEDNIDKTTSNISTFRESLKLENYINDTTYTRTDYESAKAFMQNPMKYINHSSKQNQSLEIETTEQVPLPDR